MPGMDFDTESGSISGFRNKVDNTERLTLRPYHLNYYRQCTGIGLSYICRLALETANLSVSDFIRLCVFVVNSLRIANYR